MSVLHPGDEQYHHADGSHRYAGGPAHMPLEAWQASVRAHHAEHLRTMGAPTRRREGIAVCGLPTRDDRRGGRETVERQRQQRAS